MAEQGTEQAAVLAARGGCSARGGSGGGGAWCHGAVASGASAASGASVAAVAKAEALSALAVAGPRWALVPASKAPALWRSRQLLRALLAWPMQGTQGTQGTQGRDRGGAIGAGGGERSGARARQGGGEASLVDLVPALVLELD